ncbi:hypothetical protein CPB86DRAFT_458705 [Serendipita vermifera]|nr:hypothetical protein CPB86DRAFT_458705 [Serendipita vermifera]
MSHNGSLLRATNKTRDCARYVQSLTGHQNGICSVSISPDGYWVASASHDYTIMFWDKNRAPRLMLKELGRFVTSTDFCPTSRLFATACANGKLKLWKYSTN